MPDGFPGAAPTSGPRFLASEHPAGARYFCQKIGQAEFSSIDHEFPSRPDDVSSARRQQILALLYKSQPTASIAMKSLGIRT